MKRPTGDSVQNDGWSLEVTIEEASACFVRNDVGCLGSRMKRPTGFAGLKPSAYIGERGLEDGPERF
jgi:hypothetical protein